MTYHPFRLRPGCDLKQEIQKFVQEHAIQAGCIVTCVGSLARIAVRFANREHATVLDKKMEILALSGTVGVSGVHLHIALADGDGIAIGGHLMDGCLVYTTAEIVIGELPGVVFAREIDTDTGYRELVVQHQL